MYTSLCGRLLLPYINYPCYVIHTIGFLAVFSNVDNNYSVFHSFSEKNNIQSLDLAGKITPAKYKSETTTIVSTMNT